jgi:hypothetical protein
MANDLSDDTYGLQDPDELLQQQTTAYAAAQQRATPMQFGRNGALQGVTNMFGGGPEVTKARQTQAQFQSIMEQVNANSDPDEDPLTKSMRTAQAIGAGMININPQVALRAQDQAVRLAQAQKQQQLLGVQTQEAQTRLSEEQYKLTVAKNTPQTLYMAQDQGTDPKTGLALGYQQLKSYDLTDPAAGSQIRADMASAQSNGQQPQLLNEDQMGQMKLKVAQDNYARTTQAAMIAAQQREQTALDRINNPNAAGGRGSQMQQMYTQRMLSAADGASSALENIASMPFGSNTGWFAKQMGTVSQGNGLFDLAGGALRQSLTSDDQKLYNTFTAGLGMNIAMLEKQGGLAGGTQFMNQIQAKLNILPTDSPLVVMGKLAEARASIDRNIEVTMAAKTTDPDIKALLQTRLDQMHKAVPFTREDVVAFDKAAKSDPGLTYSQWANKNSVTNASSRVGPTVLQSPPLGVDRNGKPAKMVFDSNGDPVPNNGVNQ